MIGIFYDLHFYIFKIDLICYIILFLISIEKDLITFVRFLTHHYFQLFLLKKKSCDSQSDPIIGSKRSSYPFYVLSQFFNNHTPILEILFNLQKVSTHWALKITNTIVCH